MPSRANAIPIQRVGQLARMLVDNRPTTIVQRKLQEAADKRAVTPVGQRVAGRQTSRGDVVVQRNKFKKALNFFRNLLPGHRNRNNNQQAANIPQAELVQQAPPTNRAVPASSN